MNQLIPLMAVRCFLVRLNIDRSIDRFQREGAGHLDRMHDDAEGAPDDLLGRRFHDSKNPITAKCLRECGVQVLYYLANFRVETEVAWGRLLCLVSEVPHAIIMFTYQTIGKAKQSRSMHELDR